MNLAYTLYNEQMFKMKDETQDFVDKVVSLDKYKDAKVFVDVVNNKKIFIQSLFLLESMFRNKIKNNEEMPLENYKTLIDFLEGKVQEIKKNTNKTMKKKYLRLDSEQLEIFEFLKQRYEQLLDTDDELTKKLKVDSVNRVSSEKNDKNREAEYKRMSRLERMQFALGVSYSYFKFFDADILNDVVKKIIKETAKINKKYNLCIGPYSDFAEANKVTSQAYQKALEKLAK